MEIQNIKSLKTLANSRLTVDLLEGSIADCQNRGCPFTILVVDNYSAKVLSSYLTMSDLLNSGIFTSVLKIIGVGYLVEFAGDICSEAGVSSVSNKILLAGKILILIMCLPIVKNLLEVILKFIVW